MAARLLTSLSSTRATRLHGIACHRLKPPTLAGVLRSFEGRRISSRSVRETMDVKSRSFLMYRGEAPFEQEQVVEVTTSTVDTASWSGDLLALAVYDDALDTSESEPTIKDEGLKALDAAFGGALSEVVRINGFKGKPGEAGFVRVGGSSGVRVAGLVGLGAKDASTAGSWKGIGTAIAAAARSNKAASSAVSVLGGLHAPALEVGQALTQGLCMGGYESTRFKSEGGKPCPLQTCELLSELGGGEDLAAGVAKGAKLAAGSQFTRNLVEAPPNVCTPSYLAAAAAHIAERFSEVMTLEVLEREACEEMGMGLYLGVAECSEQPPKFIHLTYRPPSGAVARKLALVGKGLTFDSGGYNLKAGAGSMIELMKFDMGGSGAVLGAARALAQLAPEGVEVHFIIASCENMVDGKGLRPGDILQGASGKTVEVNNTDAEGRLTLADALYFAQEKCGGVDAIVDIATLTGACMIALGNRVGGLFVPADCRSMVADLTAAGKAVGEKLHELPMEDSYWEQMKSSVADMKNTGGRMGGAITAALFLKQFVETDQVRWAHLDIAGPVWDEKAGAATGFGAATLAQWVLGEAAAAAQESA